MTKDKTPTANKISKTTSAVGKTSLVGLGGLVEYRPRK